MQKRASQNWPCAHISFSMADSSSEKPLALESRATSGRMTMPAHRSVFRSVMDRMQLASLPAFFSPLNQGALVSA
eukprot:14975019-Alexandrium_andersonii.AAC.1